MLAKAGCEQVLVGMVVGMAWLEKHRRMDASRRELSCDVATRVASVVVYRCHHSHPHSQFHSHSHPRARPYKEPPNPAICEGTFFDGCVGLDCSCAEIV